MESLKNALVIHASLHGGSFPGEPGSAEEINTWLADKGGIYLDKPITNPFTGGTVYVCTTTPTRIDQTTASSTDCTLQYTASNYPDPISGMTIPNGRMTLIYKIGTQTSTITAP